MRFGSDKKFRPMSENNNRPPIAFTPAEIRAFKVHAVLCAALAGAMAVVAPKGPWQVLGALLAVLLVPVPPLVIYLRRRRRR